VYIILNVQKRWRTIKIKKTIRFSTLSCYKRLIKQGFGNHGKKPRKTQTGRTPLVFSPRARIALCVRSFSGRMVRFRFQRNRAESFDRLIRGYEIRIVHVVFWHARNQYVQRSGSDFVFRVLPKRAPCSNVKHERKSPADTIAYGHVRFTNNRILIDRSESGLKLPHRRWLQGGGRVDGPSSAGSVRDRNERRGQECEGANTPTGTDGGRACAHNHKGYCLTRCRE